MSAGSSSLPNPHELGYRSTKRGRWVAAANLCVGDVLLSVDGTTVRIAAVDTRKSRITVYNLSVEKTHTFLVAKDRVVTHNDATCDFDVLFSSADGAANTTMGRTTWKSIKGGADKASKDFDALALKDVNRDRKWR